MTVMDGETVRFGFYPWQMTSAFFVHQQVNPWQSSGILSISDIDFPIWLADLLF
jgi:hypothetical protein